jgi:hypothetical protein
MFAKQNRTINIPKFTKKQRSNQMKKTTKIAYAAALFLCASFISVNELKAQNNSQQQCGVQQVRTGTIVFLNTGSNSTLTSSPNQGQNSSPNSGLKSGFIQDNATGEIYEFHYAGLEVLQINEQYIYILQITASGKIIIRDIRHSN